MSILIHNWQHSVWMCGWVCVGADRVWRVKKGAGNGEDYAFLIKLALALGACLCSQQASPTPKSNRATLMMHTHTPTLLLLVSHCMCVCVYLAAYYAWISNEVANVTQTHDRPQAPSSTSVAYAPPSCLPPRATHTMVPTFVTCFCITHSVRGLFAACKHTQNLHIRITICI